MTTTTSATIRTSMPGLNGCQNGADIIDGPDLRVYGMRELVVRDVNGLIIALGEEAPLRHRG